MAVVGRLMNILLRAGQVQEEEAVPRPPPVDL